MKSRSLLIAVSACLFCITSLAHASFSPITVYPNPIQFGTIADNTTSILEIYISNSISSSVVITSMSITGANSGNFILDGSCVGTIGVGEACTTEISFLPTALANYSANLVINIQGLTQPVTVPLQGTGGNPPPTITSLSPPSVYVNGPSFTLTVNGTGFVSGAVVYFDNTALPTTFVSATQLTVPVSSSFLTGTGSDYVIVSNPAPGGGYSNNLYFYVVGLDPSINEASPSSVVAQSTPTPIVVNGGNFMNGATIEWNGKKVATTYLSDSQLQFTPTAAELAQAGIAQLAVLNPSPGGLSGAIDFNVTYPAKVTILDLPANDLVWDPYAQRIYASMPSSYGSNGNSIAVINPATGKVTGYYFAGSEPAQLALSSDSKYLYVGLNGNGSVQRLDLPAFTQDINVSLGTNGYGYQNLALNLSVVPGNSSEWAVAEGSTGCCGTTGLFFYNNSTELADSITYPYIEQLVFDNATTAYGYYQDDLTQVTVSSNGGTSGTEWNGLLTGSLISYSGGLIYDNAGHAFNPATGSLIGSFDLNGNSCCSYPAVLADASINRLFALGSSAFLNNTFSITSFDLTKFVPVAVANLSQLNASSGANLIPWGNSGVAFTLVPGCCSSGGIQTVLVQSPSMLGTTGSKNPVPSAKSLSPSSATHGSGNFSVTIQGTGFVPGSLVTWNGTSLFASYVSPTQLTLYVPGAQISAASTAQVVVTNPAPGGGSAQALTFTIN
jgi:hypothetical protein